ncbi:lysophospholipid acyltransferase family protein [Alkalihalobacillus pseudalcaliphilus]|uniref:lysophospholipid acyltransferase family protein n=1 Tax=Alkalihalobacillus pseudalcaliphilus TaxID=79884 RepID=UPI00064DCDAD|nr:lysophospholipid acyltransferase family protein [Alkalihalobacillus pseudalcaliphilus]KMK76458.1 acyl-phosphate glycerol 3-phosphate acyltransferase [Alkalihalobacillus pseudalcaliphilus]
MGIYQFGQFACRCVLSTFYKVKIEGEENIPKEGSVLLCSNHISNFDPPLLGAYIKRPIHYMAKQELFEKPLLNKLLTSLGAFPVKRGMGDKQALRTSIQLLRDGKVLGLFPEGTRSKDGTLGKGLAGAGFFALRSDAVIIPCAVIGPYKKFNPVKMVYGEPIDFSTYREQKINAEQATEIIMNEIQKLLVKHTSR